MFVGNQQINFLREIQRYADGDIYLTGALYLLNEGQSEGQSIADKLKNTQYTRTEELIFAISLFSDFKEIFPVFKPQLLRLLGKERNMPIMYQSGGKTLRMDLVVTEKIVVSLFQTVFAFRETLPTEIYNQLSGIFRRYENFSIKCYDKYSLLDVLRTDSRIENVSTFVWFSQYAAITDAVFDKFDLMNPVWDSVAVSLSPEKYKTLFESRLHEDLSREDIQKQIDRYNALTGSSYLDTYTERSNGSRFYLLVKKGILDLWQEFRNSLGPDGSIIRKGMMEHIRQYVFGIRSIQSFHFYEKFLPEYGFEGFRRYLGDSYHGHNFSDSLLEIVRSNSKTIVKFTLNCDYLEGDKDGHRLLLYWLDEYVFFYKTEAYLPFIHAVLLDETLSDLLAWEDQRRLFELLISRYHLHPYEKERLKQKYLTAEELEADAEAQRIAESEQAQRKKLAVIAKIQDEYTVAAANGSFQSVSKFLDKYRYKDWTGEFSIASQAVCEHLPEVLEKSNYSMNTQEIARFLNICTRLMKDRKLSFYEVRGYIAKIKEVPADVS